MLGTEGDDGAFALASVTKLLTAYATLIAVEEGSVTLEDPIGDRTVRQLLSHATERRRRYATETYDAVASHVAARTGIAFDDYLGEAVLLPLAMPSTALEGSAGSGASSTVADMLAFGRELLAPTLVAAETLADATSVQFPGLAGVLPGYGNQDPVDWGLGFELRDAKSPHWTGSHNSPRTFGHFGQTGTFLWVDPDAGLACVALTDRDVGAWAKAAWPPFNDAVLSWAGSGPQEL